MKTQPSETLWWDSDSFTAVTDNCANTHVINDETYFIPGTFKPLPTGHEGVMTIGGSDHIPQGTGDVRVYWKDDDGKEFEHILKNVLFFPHSPVNIISVSCFAQELNDEEGTWIQSKWKYSTFVWDRGKYKLTIQHNASNLPSFVLNTGYKNYSMFTSFFTQKDHDPKYCALFANSTRNTALPRHREDRFILHDESARCQPCAPEEQSKADHFTPVYKLGDSLRYAKDD